MATKIMQCNCDHEFQDRTYGKKQRVHNTHGTDGKKCSCTVCGSTKDSK